jgi:cellulose synthase (UDP-forming)
MQRLLFLPTHWLSLGLRSSIAIAAPIVFLWTGISPVFSVTAADVIYYFVPMVLALAGGVWCYAPGSHFPLASQVQGTFLSFKILPTVLTTLVKPFGHPFTVTAKGGSSQSSSYARGIFWAAATLMGLTIFGLIINVTPDWRIVESADTLSIAAFWSAINVVVLFLVCMMSLQAPKRRSEERFELDERIWIVASNGTISTGRIKDISLSGVGLEGDMDRELRVRPGDTVRVFITEVGFVAGTVVRHSGQFLGIQFIQSPSVERDLLIRKMFTGGLDTTNVIASAWSATSAMLKSIWEIRTEMLEGAAEKSPDIVTSPVEQLPARSFLIPPQPQTSRLSDLVEERREMAA